MEYFKVQSNKEFCATQRATGVSRLASVNHTHDVAAYLRCNSFELRDVVRFWHAAKIIFGTPNTEYYFFFLTAFFAGLSLTGGFTFGGLSASICEA